MLKSRANTRKEKRQLFRVFVIIDERTSIREFHNERWEIDNLNDFHFWFLPVYLDEIEFSSPIRWIFLKLFANRVIIQRSRKNEK
jgi:hypothetical protein